jgi:hypothetical protein
MPSILQRLSRRTFIAASARVSALMALSSVGASRADARIAAGAPPTADAAAPLRALLENPPHAAKPMTRWWWFGGAITPPEITRELTFMRDAGLRGAEIQPLYPVEVDDTARGIEHLRYFSPEFFGVLRHAVLEARRLGLQLDFTLGSGWPYGGPFIPTGLAARRVRLLGHDVAGPREVSWNVTSLLTGDDRIVATVAAPLAPDASLDLSRAQVLEGQPRRRESQGLVVEGWQAPAGHWRVLLVLDGPTRMQVKRPTLGMEGLVVDHHNRDAIDLFLRAAGDRVLEGIGPVEGPPFASVFCDSLEVYGADWTTRLVQEFERRRGYDLRPWLPALFHDAGPATPHVRHDYHLTLSDLILDDFFAPLVSWAERRGMRARIQAHGAMGDVMRGYGLAHIPEGETIFLGDRYEVNLKHRRLASSAAHAYDKPLASAETYTWLRTPLFVTTLEMMKAATDAVFLDGINHIVNHGYSYSPPEAGEPGWAFYASTEVNHTNTWWRHYPHLARYVQRASALLQAGESVNRVGVYLPVADVYAGAGAGSLHIDVEVERHVEADLLNGLRKAGYDFDLLTDHVLADIARIEGGELCAGTGRYRVVVLPRTQFMPPESAERLTELVEAGGHLVVIGELPASAPGLEDQDRRTRALRQAFARVWADARPTAAASTAGGSIAVAAATAEALVAVGGAVPPDVRIVQPGSGSALGEAVEHVGFVHRRREGLDWYLLANVSGTPRDLRMQFDIGHRVPERWDLEQGRSDGEAPSAFVEDAQGRPVTEVEVRLAPFESCALVFGVSASRPSVTGTDARGSSWRVERGADGPVLTGTVPTGGEYPIGLASGRTRRVRAAGLPPAVDVTGPWTLTLGTRAPLMIPSLVPWTQIPGGAGFSGWGTYETDVHLPALGRDVEWWLDLGVVHETAEARLNDRPLGAAWKGTRRLACGDALVPGRNRLRIEVANLWIHHVLAHPPGHPARRLKGVGPDPQLAETVGVRWGTYGEQPPETVPPSGLLGPVRLVPLKRVRLAL